MAFTRNPNMLWNGKPLHNCSHDELVEAVTLLLEKQRQVKEGLNLTEPQENYTVFDEMFGIN